MPTEKQQVCYKYYEKQGGKWVMTYTHHDEKQVWKDAFKMLASKKLFKGTTYKSIKRVPNYDGTDTYTVYDSNGSKHEFVLD